MHCVGLVAHGVAAKENTAGRWNRLKFCGVAPTADIKKNLWKLKYLRKHVEKFLAMYKSVYISGVSRIVLEMKLENGVIEV